MDTSHPLGPAPLSNLPRGAGGGFILPGYKTYIVAVLTALYGVLLAKVSPHLGPGIANWLLANKDAIIAWLVAGGLASLRAAVAKLMDYFHHVSTTSTVSTVSSTVVTPVPPK